MVLFLYLAENMPASDSVFVHRLEKVIKEPLPSSKVLKKWERTTLLGTSDYMAIYKLDSTDYSKVLNFFTSEEMQSNYRIHPLNDEYVFKKAKEELKDRGINLDIIYKKVMGPKKYIFGFNHHSKIVVFDFFEHFN